jgi:hypothetical protein
MGNRKHVIHLIIKSSYILVQPIILQLKQEIKRQESTGLQFI